MTHAHLPCILARRAPPARAALAPRRYRVLAFALALLASAPLRAAAVIEQLERVSVEVPVAGGGSERRDIAVTVVREDGAGRRPFMVLEHGRGVDTRSRLAVGVQSYPANARYFAELGFVVFIPTRVGYGVSGGPDIEDTGGCESKHYEAAIAAALAETRQLLAHAGTLSYVDRTRGVILGESFGGLIAVAAASAELPGVRATVNFAGGDGGDSLRHVDEPCQPGRLAAAFATYGASNRTPTLWLYSRNDRFWGPAYPKRWFSAFSTAGGRGHFVELPADKNNGHYIFNRNPPAWQPALERFLAGNGFAAESPPRR